MKRDLYSVIIMIFIACCLTLIFHLSIYAVIGMNYASLQYRLTRAVELVLDILIIILGFLIISSILYDMCNKDEVVDVKKKNIIFHILSFLTVFSLILNAFVIILSLSFKMNFENKTEAYLNIYKNNDEYILSTGKYMEDNKKEYDYNGNTYYLGSRIYDGDFTDDDKTKLANQINSLLPVALKYDYKFVYNSSYNSNYYSNCISGIIAIDDFNEFYQPLKKGNFPKERNEILIYDYLEESLIKSGYISDDAIGKKIYDESNNYEFVITGVINSNHKKYAYLENRNFKGEFQESYLNELSSIYVSNKYFQNDANHKRIGLYILLKKRLEL